jgi:hypothetical protein
MAKHVWNQDKESNMCKVIVSDQWLKACGLLDLSGVALPAVRVNSASWSLMGDCYEVTLPDGSTWAVFTSRGVTLV